MFPSDEEIATLKVFPDIESRSLEFKQSTDVPFTKILPTICAFLNGGGGNIVFGVRDNQEIVGIKTNDKRFDTFLLLFDNILHSNLIAATDGEPLHPDAIRTRCVPCWNELYLLIVTITPKPKVYQIKDGSIYHRLNASNMRISGACLYNESDLMVRLENAKRSIQDQYQGLLKKVENQMLESQRKVKELERDNEETMALLHSKILREKEEYVRHPGYLTYLTCGLL
jgi:predicted HTH transcriptional regulator